MIYIETGSTDVYYNFGLEYYFAAEKKLPEPVLLFWQTTPTLMVGKYQNILEEINKPYADAHKIRLVRRMSGGGTIYTDLGGWQFTFIEHSDQTQIDFSQYIGPVVDAVRELGADAGFNGRNDLLIGGRKFSGNAQYRLPGCIVHHGSLLYDTDLAQMAAATTVDPYKIQSKSIKSVRDRVTNISEHLPRKLPAEQFKACMLRHLMRGSTQTYCPTPADDARIRALAEEKFAAWDAVYGRNPRFNIERTGHFAGGKFTFRLDVQRGVIRSASVWGDFFSTLGTVLAVANRANMLDENGNLPGIERPFLVDAVGTCFGALTGNTTITTFVESTSGVEAGGRTGLTALVAGVMFLLTIFLAPLFVAIPYAATGPALIYVGFLMLKGFTEIDFTDYDESIGPCVMMMFTAFTGTITNGLGAGIIVHVLVKLVRGKAKEVHPIMYLLCALMVVYFIVG